MHHHALQTQIMVANVRCEDIKNDQLAAFTGDQAWAALVEEARAGIVRDFGTRASGLRESCLDGCARAGAKGAGHVLGRRWAGALVQPHRGNPQPPSLGGTASLLASK